MKKLLITIVILGAIFVVAALWARGRAMGPTSPFYRLGLAGEWLDVNFLVFGAPEKQAKHLELAARRLEEYLQLVSILTLPESKRLASLAWAYEMELARAEYMAEQLALLDHKFIFNIEQVNRQTTKNLDVLLALPQATPGRQNFIVSAQLYNSYSMKNLLHLHQHTKADSLRYNELVRFRCELAQKNSLAGAEILDKAGKVLAEGRELEWAYDLCVGAVTR